MTVQVRLILSFYMKMAGWGYLFEDDADFEYKMKIEDLTGGGSRTAPVQYSEQTACLYKISIYSRREQFPGIVGSMAVMEIFLKFQ